MTTTPLTGDDAVQRQLAELGLAGSGEVHRNPPCTPALFDRLLDKARGYLHGRDLYVFDGFAGAERTYRLPSRVIAEVIWHALFANTLFARPTLIDLTDFVPGFTVVDCGPLRASADFDGTRTSVFVGISFTRKLVLVLGSMYGGEVKEAVFTVMTYLMPQRSVLPTHCIANMGRAGDVALFFGLSGTGKATLSADPSRRFIGDDEHGASSADKEAYDRSARELARMFAEHVARYEAHVTPGVLAAGPDPVASGSK
jgi:phosphoenolpyruvate carboxykinase (ATP)